MTSKVPEANILGVQHAERVEVPDLAEILNRRMAETMTKINCCHLGTVKSFNSLKQTVTASINYKAVVDGKLYEYPLLLDVPVFVYSGGGSRITMPVAAGDTCILLFNDRSIDNWLTTGDVSSVPNGERVHDMSDAICFVGLFPYGGSLSGFNGNGPEMRGGNAKVSIENNKIKMVNASVSYGFQLAAMWACRILMTASTLAQQKLMNTLLTALAADSGLNATSRAAASAAAGGGVIHDGVLTTQGANEVTAKDNIGRIIDGSGV